MDLTNVQDIEEFYRAGTRADNDALNRVREKAFLILNNPEHPYFRDAVYGDKWRKLLNGLRIFIKNELVLKNLPSESFTFIIEPRGGLSNHFDLYIRVPNLIDILFEFKFKSMPQFANYQESHGYIQYSLPEMWYNGPLKEICALYKDLKIPIPDFESYKIGCRQFLTGKSKESFYKQFRAFDEKTNPMYKQKELIAAAGIKKYLIENARGFNIVKLKKKLLDDQTGKVYGIWNPLTSLFKRYEIKTEELKPIAIYGIKDNHLYLTTESKETVLDLYLRWKNTNGICNPMWQISLKPINKLPKGITLLAELSATSPRTNVITHA